MAATPVVTRVRSAATTKSPATATLGYEGASRTPRSVKTTPIAKAMLHRMSSLKTQGVAARKSMTEPARTVASQMPASTASSRLTATAPRARTRTRHNSSPLMVPARIQAAAIIGAVKAEAERWGATARKGMRSSDGKMPK